MRRAFSTFSFLRRRAATSTPARASHARSRRPPPPLLLLPLPLLLPLGGTEGGGGGEVLNVAVTLVEAPMLSVHVDVVPEHAPAHPPNSLPVPGLAVSVTLVPGAYCCVQSAPQVIPGPEVETV